MTGMKCCTCNCEHNCNFHCNAGVITVGKNAACKTKQKRQNGVLEQTKVNIEAGKDFDFQKNHELLIQCDCIECEYNRNSMCANEIVNFNDGIFQTKCFSKKIVKK